MKGSNVFTRAQHAAIDAHLRTLRRQVGTARQKPIRDALRAMGFYVSDWGWGLTADDFHALVKSGAIKVRG